MIIPEPGADGADAQPADRRCRAQTKERKKSNALRGSQRTFYVR